MFDNVCMNCAKYLDSESGLVYCTDSCQSADRSSPSLSSTSSLLPSPYISSTLPVHDVPLLMLPANKRTSAGTCSSSASSDVASVFEDDYDFDDHVLVNHHPFDHIPDHDSTIKLHRSPPGLSFARRPSSTDNRTLIPILHLHDTSSSSHASSRTTTATAATRTRKSSNTSTHRHSRSHDMHLRLASSTPIPIPTISSGTPPPSHPAPHLAPLKPKRHRSSLPTYFLHLSLSSHTQIQSTSPPSVDDGGHINASGSGGGGGGGGGGGDANANANANANASVYLGKTTDVETTPRSLKRQYGTRGKGDRDTDSSRPYQTDRDMRAEQRVFQPGFGSYESSSYGRAVPIPGTQEVERGRVKERARVRRGRYVSESEDDENGSQEVAPVGGRGIGERRGRSRVVTPRLES